jgi:hypothetical protein
MKRSPVRLTLFSVEEAKRVAQEIRPELVRLSRLNREFTQIRDRAEVLAVVTSGASVENPDMRDLQGLADRRDRLGAEIKLAIEAIHRRGCVVKDVEKGLVDFYTLSGDRLVFLCWHMGETEVAHWHPLDGGFAARKPLDRSERE